MNIELLQKYCLSLPHATATIQWGNDSVLNVAWKMFAITCLDRAAGHCLSFKCTPENFSKLIERDDITPAQYVGRFHWISLKRFDAIHESEIKSFIQESYEMVVAKLPKKVRANPAKRERKPQKVKRSS